jgi:hypothetical protein
VSAAPSHPAGPVFATGLTQPVYLWAGQATIALQRIKFPDIGIDTHAHLEAHEPAGTRVLAGLGTNLAFLSMNWGFPPEIEQQYWREFERAVATYRATGISVFGYVQASNCVSTGSYTRADWYARDRRGRRVPYYHGRFMTCWNHTGWLDQVKGHALRALDAGAAGVFFDNVWMGATPWTLGRAVAGFAGCACVRCAAAYQQNTGLRIPSFVDSDAESQRYLQWRASVVRGRFAEWRNAIKTQAPHAHVLANNCDVILRDTLGLFGLDLSALAPLQDALLVENVAMPHSDERRGRLVANAIVLKAVRALAPGKPILALTYEHGIGLDRLPSAPRWRRALVEAAAVGALPTLKGSEYIDPHGRFSVITAPAFAPLRAALAPLLEWLREHAGLYQNVQPAPLVYVPLQPHAAGATWLANRAALTLALALLRAQVPFAFVSAESPGGAPLFPLEQNPFDDRRRKRLTDDPRFRRLLDPAMSALARGYFGTVWLRRSLDRSGLTRRFLESACFDLPSGWAAAQQLLPDRQEPLAAAEAPMLLERWQHDHGRYRLHLVNYRDEPIDVRVRAGGPIILHSPDPGTVWLQSTHERLRLQSYAVLECD